MEHASEVLGQICGRKVTVKAPIKHTPPKGRAGSHAGKPRARFLVDGINNSKGPIRFKSREGAERHIRNIGMAIE